MDNAESMGPYRERVRSTLELLSALTERYDPDHLDLYFSTESIKHRPKTNQQMLSLFDQRRACGMPDMRERFASIIQKYQEKLGRKHHFSRLLHKPSHGPRRLSLYVLTDGVWQPYCTLVREIKNLVALMAQHNMPNKHIGIQFIRFGDDPEGKQRLKELDSELGLDMCGYPLSHYLNFTLRVVLWPKLYEPIAC